MNQESDFGWIWALNWDVLMNSIALLSPLTLIDQVPLDLHRFPINKKIVLRTRFFF